MDKGMGKIIFKIFFSLISILYLSSCTYCGEPPSCPDSLGLPCARIDQINKLIDCGKLGVSENINCSEISNSQNNFPDNSLWKKAEVMQIWFAPFEDDEQNYHASAFVYAIAKPGHWKQ